jgi:hypothetical protein
MGKQFEEILRDKFLYLNVPHLKLNEIRFFFNKMKEAFSKIETFSSENIQQVVEISYYASAFYSAVMGFFDSLAIFHTKNREDVYDKIHFNKWIDYQTKKHPEDSYLKFLKKKDEEWITHFRKDRNKFIHWFHIYMSINPLQHLELRNRTLVIKNFEIEKGKKELIPYCEEIVNKIGKLVEEVNKNRDKEYLWNN